MTKPIPRADLVKAVSEAQAIVGEAIPVNGGIREELREEADWRCAQPPCR